MHFRCVRVLGLFFVPLVLQVSVHAAEADRSLAVVAELAQINGQALACQDVATVAKAKKLMLAHAPKTARFGSLFEETTNSSYLGQIRGTMACPDPIQTATTLEALAKRLQEVLPANSTGTQ